MVPIEQVERLRQYADITYEEARDALEAADGNLLDAIVMLERQGKINETGRAVKNGANTAPDGSVRVMPEVPRERQGEQSRTNGENQFEQWLRTMFVVYRKSDGWEHFRLPLPVVIIAVIFAFWVTLPIMVVGLVCGVRYRCEGANVHVAKVNKVLDDVGDAADSVTNDVKTGFSGSNSRKPDSGESPRRTPGVTVTPEPSDISGDVKMPDMPEVPEPPDVIDVDYSPVTAQDVKPPFRGPEQL